ncbi:MAG: aldose 1-epimerase family protein, partial [candidate division KSB1 bacterium]|nr:aldose 1-epimerase family protein [candidate division KSB1 bacterium]
MISLFGLQLPREELIRRLGDLSQLAGFQQAELTDGQARGVRVIHVWNGSGLEFTVVVDRGMDISHCRYCGVPLAWRSPIGEAHPHAYDPRALGWLKTFYGGLVVTCGLTQAGAPCVDNGEELGLHGRYSHLPAEGLRCETAWEGDDLLIRISGTIREWIMFGPHLTLRRTILTRLGSPWIRLEDIVTNEGTKPSPLMLLYHVNPGWPLVEAGAELVGAVASVRPRDEEAAKGQAYWDRIHEPRAAFREQVFYIDHLADPQGRVEVALVNPSLRRRGLALVLRYPKNELPRFSFWKQLDEKEYVVGLEPATCWVEGRARELARGAVETLAPGESRSFHLEIGVLE